MPTLHRIIVQHNPHSKAEQARMLVSVIGFPVNFACIPKYRLFILLVFHVYLVRSPCLLQGEHLEKVREQAAQMKRNVVRYQVATWEFHSAPLFTFFTVHRIRMILRKLYATPPRW